VIGDFCIVAILDDMRQHSFPLFGRQPRQQTGRLIEIREHLNFRQLTACELNGPHLEPTPRTIVNLPAARTVRELVVRHPKQPGDRDVRERSTTPTHVEHHRERLRTQIRG
jgi:hypothetical protein